MIDTLLNFVIILTLLSIVAAIVFFVRKNSTFGKMFLMIALGAFVISVGLSMLDNSRKEPDVQPEPSAVTGTMTIDEILDSSLPFENCEITLEEDTMMISVWEDGVAAGALKAISGDQEAAAEWNDLLEMFCDITNEVQTQFEENGFQGYHVSINLLNERNHENILATITDGEIVYDVTEE